MLTSVNITWLSVSNPQLCMAINIHLREIQLSSASIFSYTDSKINFMAQSEYYDELLQPPLNQGLSQIAHATIIITHQ